jgi:hypothetical protein
VESSLKQRHVFRPRARSVRDGGACHGIAEKDFRPGGSFTVWRVDAKFGKDFVKRAKLPGLMVEEFPKPVNCASPVVQLSNLPVLEARA